jgi:predicted TIM-barrel fold metal-dependent hydrolase
MRINGHAHIFNLQTVLTNEAIEIMVNRIRGKGIPDYFVDAVREFFQEQLHHPEYLNEDELLAKLVQLAVKQGRDRGVADIPLTIHRLGNGTGGVGVRALEAAMNSMAGEGGGAGVGTNGWDIYHTLRVAMQPDIPSVAGKLLSHLGPDDALVALMMDITSASEPDRDRRNFLRQIRGTQDAALAYPGRVLPFIAVNPKRADHYERLERAILEDGFLGVKLYPSLGFSMNTAEMRRVLDFCRESDTPVTIHTSSGGFKRDDATAQFSHPEHWSHLLQPDDTLRVCFAHCGGWGGLSGQVQDQVEWAEKVFEFMDTYDGVYADVAYHVEQMKSPAVQDAYFTALRDMIDLGGRGDRIIFGTDSWLLRLDVDDELFWTYFEEQLGPERFRKVARDAPARFLGLPLDGAEARPNIQRHLDWLEDRADATGGSPARWVRDARSDVPWRVTPRDSTWTPNNPAHAIIHDLFRDQVRRSTFEELGPTRLGDCEYFRRHAGGPTEMLVKGRVMRIMGACNHAGARPEAEHDNRSIDRTLRQAITDPNRTVADVGRTVDSVYLFPTEVPA